MGPQIEQSKDLACKKIKLLTCFVMKEISCCLFLTRIRLILLSVHIYYFKILLQDDLLIIDNPYFEHRGSYMSAHVLLILLNELEKRDKMRGLPSILSLFRNEFNKFNNARARMLDSIYHMILRLL